MSIFILNLFFSLEINFIMGLTSTKLNNNTCILNLYRNKKINVDRKTFMRLSPVVCHQLESKSSISLPLVKKDAILQIIEYAKIEYNPKYWLNNLQEYELKDIFIAADCMNISALKNLVRNKLLINFESSIYNYGNSYELKNIIEFYKDFPKSFFTPNQDQWENNTLIKIKLIIAHTNEHSKHIYTDENSSQLHNFIYELNSNDDDLI